MILKDDPVRSQALRDSAKGQRCTLRIPGICNHNDETTVLAHMPFGHGGWATKASDDHAAFACSDCHDMLDGRHRVSIGIEPVVVLECCIRGMGETRAIWRQQGLVLYKGDRRK